MSAACPGRPICWRRFAPAPRARRSRRTPPRSPRPSPASSSGSAKPASTSSTTASSASRQPDLRLWPVVELRLRAARRLQRAGHDSGVRAQESSVADLALTSFGNRRDWKRFGEFYQDQSSGLIGSAPTRRTRRPVCTGPIRYKGQAQTKADIDNLKQAMAANGIAEGFMTSVAPASFARAEDLHYRTEEDFVVGAAEAMREEYQAIVDAGLILQIDDPSLSDNWDMINPEPPLAEYKKFALVRIDALNHALRGLPEDRIRYHICWGSWHGPHTTDIPLADILDVLLRVTAGAYSVEAGNVRHEHEWRVWQHGALPDGKLLIPGRRQPRHQCGRASAPGRRPDRQIRRGGRARERHCLDRLRSGRPHPSADRLGQARGFDRGRSDRQQGAVALSRVCRREPYKLQRATAAKFRRAHRARWRGRRCRRPSRRATCRGRPPPCRPPASSPNA